MRGWILTFVLFWSAVWKEHECSWLQGKKGSVVETVEQGLRPASYGSCPDNQAKCWCGDEAHRQQTIINVKQCPFSTSWGSQCEPCTPSNVLCHRLDNCSRCSQNNPHAICAACPPDRHGLLCEKERPCKTPNVTDHMTIHPHVTRRGAYKLEFRCTGGRVRHGPKVIRCVKDKGTWNKDPPQCVLPMRCSTLPTSPFPFTHVKPGSLTSERVVYECEAGYVTKGRVFETLLHCENGAWVQIGDSVECEPSPKCTSLPMFMGARPKTGTTIKSAYLSGECVSYECEDAFKPNNLTLQANFSLVCTEGLWDGQMPECELRGCRRLNVEHGTVTYSEQSGLNQSDFLSLHTTARVTCQGEFTLEDSDNVTCTHTGLWQPAVPKCIPKVCQDRQKGRMCSVKPLSPDVVAETNTSEIYPGQSMRFGCKESTYRILGVGHVERICLYNGTLTGHEIQCHNVSAESVCKIHVPADDRHLQFCKGQHCTEVKQDTDLNQEYDFPRHVISVRGPVEFSCNSEYYCLDGNSSQRCPWKGGVITAPRCIPMCGKRMFPKQPLIMGGRASAIEAWPWQAALLEVHGDQVEFLCGATLIDDVWAITAAHCVIRDNMQPLDTQYLRLTYGLSSSAKSERIAVDNKRNEKFKLSEVIHHNKYDRKSLNNDIALLRLKHPVEMSRKVGVVCLPDGLQQLVGGEEGVTTGWGRTETEAKSPELRELPLTVLNNTECKEHFESEGFNTEVITEGMMCAKSNSTLQDTTDGDSGGPFCVQDEGGLWVLEGIVSWGAPNSETKALNRRAHVKLSSGTSLLHTCSGSACHSGLTRVGRYINWIQNVTGKSLGASRCV